MVSAISPRSKSSVASDMAIPPARALAEPRRLGQPKALSPAGRGGYGQARSGLAGAGAASSAGGAVSGWVEPRWQVKQVTLSLLESVTPKSWLLMRWAIASILRATSFLSFASDAKSNVDSGFPSSPTWQ